MLLIQVTYTMRPGQRDAFVRKIRESGILDAIRGEEGCLGYSYYLPEEEDGTLLLIEKWSSEGPPGDPAHEADGRLQTGVRGRYQADFLHHSGLSAPRRRRTRYM